MAFTLAEFDAHAVAGRCECGTPLNEHPPLAQPLDWSHGRPCGKSFDKRSGWGTLSSIRPAPGPGIQVRRPAAPVITTPVLTTRQAEIERAIERNAGNVAAAAAELGITPQAVYQARVKIRTAHGQPPGPTRGMTERRTMILAAVHRRGGNRRAAARDLGLAYATVNEAMSAIRRLGVVVPVGARPGPRKASA